MKGIHWKCKAKHLMREIQTLENLKHNAVYGSKIKLYWKL